MLPLCGVHIRTPLTVGVYHSSRVQGEFLGYWVVSGEHPASGSDFMLKKLWPHPNYY